MTNCQRLCLAKWSMLAVLAGTAHSEELRIQALDTTGQLTFNRIPSATVYRVEWAPSPGGPWQSFADASSSLDAIYQFSDSSYTCSVPMCYRTVAVVTNGSQSDNTPPYMILIPSGSFVMGACTNVGQESIADAEPQHAVNISAFYIDKYEVSKGYWNYINAYTVGYGFTFDNPGAGKELNYPVHAVNWYDCIKWCNARSEVEGLTPCYTTFGEVYRTGRVNFVVCNWNANGYRLPTEAEWEKAARGGSADMRFPWGDDNEIQHARANYYAVQQAYDISPTWGYHPWYYTGEPPETSPVGDFAPNGYGLYDMAGNVAEWCWDGYSSSYYSNSPAADPKGSPIVVSRVIRGGSWDTSACEARSAARNHAAPSVISYEGSGWFVSGTGTGNLGFRCVRKP